MKIITAIDKPYLPGLIALYNSYLEHCPEHDFICMVHDTETQEAVDKLGISWIHIDWEQELPVTKEWPVASIAMYSRLIIPEYFDDPEILWLDADTIILKPLEFPDLEDYPCGGVVTSTTTIGQQVAGDIPNYLKNEKAITTGVLAYNTEEWHKEGILEKCEFTMTLPYDFKYVVQSVLSFALEGDFKELPYCWREFANRGPVSKGALIAHFVGQKFLPWKNKRIPNIKLWEYYYNNGKIKLAT